MLIKGFVPAGLIVAIGWAGLSQPGASPGGRAHDEHEDVPLEVRIFQEQVVNMRPVQASSDLADYQGLKCRVHLRTEFDPRASTNGMSRGTSLSGLRNVNDVPVGADGLLSEVGDEAIVVTGPNGHVWIPRGQVRAIEFIQNPSTAPNGE